MSAQASLHRLSAMASRPKEDKIKELSQKLGIDWNPEFMKLGTNEAITNALVEIAVGQGKSEAEIAAAVG